MTTILNMRFIWNFTISSCSLSFQMTYFGFLFNFRGWIKFGVPIVKWYLPAIEHLFFSHCYFSRLSSFSSPLFVHLICVDTPTKGKYYQYFWNFSFGNYFRYNYISWESQSFRINKIDIRWCWWHIPST